MKINVQESSFDSSTGGKLFAGYEANSIFSFEGGYTDKFRVFGKVGFMSWKLESGYEGFVNRDDEKGTDILFGVGTDYYLSEKFAIRGEWSRYKINGADYDFASLGVTFHFK